MTRGDAKTIPFQTRAAAGARTDHHAEHLLGLGVDVDDVLLERRHLGHEVVPALALLLLQLDGDAAHRRPLDPLHQMRDEPGGEQANTIKSEIHVPATEK